MNEEEKGEKYTVDFNHIDTDSNILFTTLLPL